MQEKEIPQKSPNLQKHATSACKGNNTYGETEPFKTCSYTVKYAYPGHQKSAAEKKKDPANSWGTTGDCRKTLGKRGYGMNAL